MKSFLKKIVAATLSWEARAVIRKNKPSIIAITGSVGKTSTKDAAYHILASAGVFVRKSEKSFNSEIGLPLTVLGLQNAWNSPIAWMHNIFQGLGLVFPVLGGDNRAPYPKCLVLEVGADHPGDIENLTRWLKPDIAVVTAVSKIPVHVEFFPSPEAVLKEKLALPRGVRPGGKLVLPATDPSILAVRSEVPEKTECFTFAVDSQADVAAFSSEIIYDVAGNASGMSFELKYKSESAKVSVAGVAGNQHIYSLTAAAAISLAYGVSFASVAEAIPKYQAPRGRMNVLPGILGTTLIDDTYNSSPDALKEALKVLGEIKSLRKIAVLGDMMELGKFSAEQHRKAGEQVARALAKSSQPAQSAQTTDIVDTVAAAVVADPRNMLITVGIRARDIGEGAISAGFPKEMIQNFDTSAEAGEWLRNLLHKESILQGSSSAVILVKGSQSGRMERVTYALLDDQSRAGEFLVRQETEWLAKK